jgi:hypothetical protein
MYVKWLRRATGLHFLLLGLKFSAGESFLREIVFGNVIFTRGLQFSSARSEPIMRYLCESNSVPFLFSGNLLALLSSQSVFGLTS